MFYNGNDNWTITITFIKGEKFKITNNIQDDDHKSYGPENYTIDEDGDYTILFNGVKA